MKSVRAASQPVCKYVKSLTLNVHTPVLRVKAESLQGTALAQALGLVNKLIATVVTCARVTFRVLVCVEMYISVTYCRESWGEGAYFALHCQGHRAQPVM
jgi:hypothetical protein